MRKIEKENKLEENKDSNKLKSKQVVAAEGENEDFFSGTLQQISQRQDNLERGRPRYKFQYRGQRSRGKSRHFASGRYDRYEKDQSEDHPTVKCRRRVMECHIERGCRENKDVHRKALIYSKSTSRDRP